MQGSLAVSGKGPTCPSVPAAGDMSSSPGSGRSPGEGKGNPPRHSCLENPMDRGPGGLQSTGSQRVGHDLMTKQQWTVNKIKM